MIYLNVQNFDLGLTEIWISRSKVQRFQHARSFLNVHEQFIKFGELFENLKNTTLIHHFQDDIVLVECQTFD